MESFVALAVTLVTAILKAVQNAGGDPAKVLAQVQTDADAELAAIISAEKIALAREAAARGG